MPHDPGRIQPPPDAAAAAVIRKNTALLHALAIDLRTVQSQLGGALRSPPPPPQSLREANSNLSSSVGALPGSVSQAITASTVTVLSLRASVMTALRCLKVAADCSHDPPAGSSWETR